jgi:glucose-1-phosphate thymidylyltransferase
MKGVVLAGGHGTRLRPLTHTGPKQLIPIANKPNILYCIEDLVEAGIGDIAVVLGDNMPDRVRELLGDGSAFGCTITYIHQGQPRGIAHAVGLAEEFVGGDPFVVYLGDNILKGGIRHMVDEFSRSSVDALVGLCRVPNPEAFGVAELDGEGNLRGLEEKPKNPKSDLALIGIYLLRPAVFDAIRLLRPSWRNELEITEAISLLLKRGGVTTHIVSGWWKDTGKPEDILEANRLVLDDQQPYNHGTVEKGATVTGRVAIGKGTLVREGSSIRGPVVIGRNCEVGPDSYVGPYTAIGDRCVLRGCHIEASILMEGGRILCGKPILDSLIGVGSTITAAEAQRPQGHRLIIGDNSLVSL